MICSHTQVDRHYAAGEFDSKIADRWNHRDFLSHPEWGQDWISFDGVVYDAVSDRVYCGLTRFDGDIFYAWDRRTESFVSLGFAAVMDRFDAKFHRSMELDGDVLYLATALLHDVDQYYEAPGGGIYRHDLRSGATEKLGIPMPHNYIQSIVHDPDRQCIYALQFTPEWLSVFDLESGTARPLGPLSGGLQMAQGENLVLDDRGRVWCTWSATKAWQSSLGKDVTRLCYYDPANEKMHYLDHGLPHADGSLGYCRLEGLFNLGNGMLYASGGNGSLYRIDPGTAAVSLIGTPISDRRSRLTSLARHSDGFAYGITGRDGDCVVLRFDPRTDQFETGDRVVDADGTALFQCHDVTITPDGILFAGENDHPERSGRLWEIPIR